MKHLKAPRGYNSLDEVVKKINSFDKREFESFLRYFGESFKAQADNDLRKGYKKLPFYANKIYSHLRSLDGCNNYKIERFAYDVALLKYDSIKEVLERIDGFDDYKDVIGLVSSEIDALSKVRPKKKSL